MILLKCRFRILKKILTRRQRYSVNVLRLTDRFFYITKMATPMDFSQFDFRKIHGL